MVHSYIWYLKQHLAVPYNGKRTLLPFLTSEFPVQPIFSLSHRYRIHFLCVASFHYTPDYSHSFPSPVCLLFPPFILVSFWLFNSLIWFPVLIIHYSSIQLQSPLVIWDKCVCAALKGHDECGFQPLEETRGHRTNTPNERKQLWFLFSFHKKGACRC